MKKQITIFLLFLTFSVSNNLPNAKETIQKAKNDWFIWKIANLNFENLSLENLDHARLPGACCYYTNFSHASLYDTDLYNATLIKADMRLADLRNADLRNADLTGARVDGIILTGAKVKDSNWKGVIGLANAQKILLIKGHAKNVPALTEEVEEDQDDLKGQIAILTRFGRFVAGYFASEKTSQVKTKKNTNAKKSHKRRHRAT